MRHLIFISILYFANLSICNAQITEAPINDKKHGVVWSAGLFKSWLTDQQVKFNKIGNEVTPVFIEQKKMGVALQSHYMYKAIDWLGVGAHLGLGLDIYSNIKAPVVLLGISLSFGNDHQIIIDLGWADGKRKIVDPGVMDQLINENYTEIPEIYGLTELNTHYYFGLSYKIF